MMRRLNAGQVLAVATSIVAALAFQVISVLPAAADDGNIWVSPSSGVPGSTIQISGENFDDEETLQVCWGDVRCSNLGHVSTDDDGNFSVMVSVPANVDPGSHLLGVCERGDDDCATAGFDVQPLEVTVPPTTTSLPVTTTAAVTTTTQRPTTTQPTPPATAPPSTAPDITDQAPSVSPTPSDQDTQAEGALPTSGTTTTSSPVSRPYLGPGSNYWANESADAARDQEDEPDSGSRVLSAKAVAGGVSSDSEIAAPAAAEGTGWTVLELLLLGLAVLSTLGVCVSLLAHAKRSSA